MQEKYVIELKRLFNEKTSRKKLKTHVFMMTSDTKYANVLAQFEEQIQGYRVLFFVYPTKFVI